MPTAQGKGQRGVRGAGGRRGVGLEGSVADKDSQGDDRIRSMNTKGCKRELTCLTKDTEEVKNQTTGMNKKGVGKRRADSMACEEENQHHRVLQAITLFGQPILQSAVVLF